MPRVFLSDRAVVEGDVRLGQNANIWHCAVLRADINHIEVGENTNIQDGCIVHVTHELPAVIGKNVTVGHGAIVHGCRIEDNVLIGMGAVILDGAVVGKNSVVGAGAVVLENQKIEENSLAAGIPAKIKRVVCREEALKISESAAEYVKLAQKNLKETNFDRRIDD